MTMSAIQARLKETETHVVHLEDTSHWVPLMGSWKASECKRCEMASMFLKKKKELMWDWQAWPKP